MNKEKFPPDGRHATPATVATRTGSMTTVPIQRGHGLAKEAQ